MFFDMPKTTMPNPDRALPGRDSPMAVPERHAILDTPLSGPWPGMAEIQVGMGCFWGAERKFWTVEGVVCTAVGYGAGFTPNPTYQEVCSGQTGHNELVRVIYDPAKVSLGALLKVFWESHDPTQGMRQGNDVGTQYRSGIYVSDASQLEAVRQSKAAFQERLTAAGYGPITTEIVEAGPFFYAEEYHQQYLAKNPNGYCGLGGTGVSCPIGTGVYSDSK